MAKPGEIYYSDMPYPEAGVWVKKQRPLLVLAVYGNQTSQAALMCMITSSPKRLLRPRKSDVLIEDWEAAGLSKASLIAPQRLLTLDAAVLVRVLGTVSEQNLADAHDKLRAFVNNATSAQEPKLE